MNSWINPGFRLIFTQQDLRKASDLGGVLSTGIEKVKSRVPNEEGIV
jgi:hypothetical protein